MTCDCNGSLPATDYKRFGYWAVSYSGEEPTITPMKNPEQFGSVDEEMAKQVFSDLDDALEELV